MDCNKDEAIKCKGIAEKKLEEEDVSGARRFALKAQSLFPKLDGLSDFLEVINLYVASQKKINGEIDLYGIFGLDPCVDDVTLRKKYRNMALALHPDKNKAVGANGAFFILSQAWNVLSDKDTRLAYNQRLNLRAPHPPFSTDKNGFNSAGSSSSQYVRNTAAAAKPQHIPTQSRTSATATNPHCNPPLWPKNNKAATGAQHVSSPKKAKKTATNSRHAATSTRPRKPRAATAAQHIPSNRKTSKTATSSMFVGTQSQPRNHATVEHKSACNPQLFPVPPSGTETFWTSCHGCKWQYEYLMVYLNQNLLCSNSRCRKPFFATQKPAPPLGSISSSPGCCAFHQQRTGLSAASRGSESATSGTRVSQTERGQSVVENLKRGREEAVSVAKSEERVIKWHVGGEECKNA